jgi:hypothetical protein
VKLPIFLHRRAPKTQGHDEENHPGHFQPQLVNYTAEGACGGADRCHHSARRAVSSRLVSGDTRDDPELPQGRDLIHASILAASSAGLALLWNRSEPFLTAGHLRNKAGMSTSALTSPVLDLA